MFPEWLCKCLHIETIFIGFFVVCIILSFFFKDNSLMKPLEGFIEPASAINFYRKSKPPPSKKVNYHEEECRKIFERLFGKKFPSVRPKWLENPGTNKPLELDGFCEDIVTPEGKGLAFEYDGVQHAQYSPHFHRNGPQEFNYQIARDKWKTAMCKKRGVTLIRIPHYIVEHKLEDFIRKALEEKGIPTED